MDYDAEASSTEFTRIIMSLIERWKGVRLGDRRISVIFRRKKVVAKPMNNLGPDDMIVRDPAHHHEGL